jgi:hypothetical protein
VHPLPLRAEIAATASHRSELTLEGQVVKTTLGFSIKDLRKTEEMFHHHKIGEVAGLPH